MKISLAPRLGLAILFSLSMPSGLGQSVSNGEWPVYGGDKSFDRYSPLALIDRNNVAGLTVAWSRAGLDPEIKGQFPDLNPTSYFKGTPIMVNGVLYAPNGVGLVEAFDAASGTTKWLQKPFEATMREAAGVPTRGVAYWKDKNDERIISQRGEYLYALDAKTGAAITTFGVDGRVSLNRHLENNARFSGSAGPFIVNDVIVVGGNGVGSMGDGGWEARAKPEDVRGYDVRTGKQLWTFHVMPEPGDPARTTWGKGSADYVGNMAAWGPLTVDEKLGYIYLPLSAPTVSYYGGHRPGKNLYADSLVCLNGKTGKVVWYYQLIHHDLWEYDSSSAPVLGDVTVDGKKIKAVFATNKNAFLYSFDRVTGKPIWPIEERPVPKSDVPGEEAWPTQPFPSKPVPFDRQGVSESDLIDYTPELHKQALEIASHYVMGPIYTPPTLRSSDPDGKKGTLALPSDWGAGNWNTGAFDPETGVYYAVSTTEPAVLALVKATDPAATMAYSEPGGAPRLNATPGGAARAAPATAQPGTGQRGASYQQTSYGSLTIQGLPIIKPPYGRITAYDMNKGEKLWMVANGDGPRNHPLIKDLNLPPMGNPGRPVALVTKTLLFVGDSSDAVMGRAGVVGPAKLRAYDKATGALISQADLPAGATGAPITYLAGGRQYIVVPIGSNAYGGGWICFTVKADK
jgi:quinoprotein glucose dehydrogenase